MTLKEALGESVMAGIKWHFFEAPDAHSGDWLVYAVDQVSVGEQEWSVEYLKNHVVRAVLSNRDGIEQERRFKVRVILEEI